MWFGGDKSADAYANAIKNVQTNGSAHSSSSDLELVKEAAKQAGSVGDDARRALNYKP